MKYELDPREAMESQDQLRQLETDPPRLDRAETAGTDTPPRLGRADDRLGGTVMEMQLEMRKAEHERLQEQLGEARLGGSATELMLEMSKMRLEQAQAELAAKQAAADGYEEPLKTPEYYQQKKEALQDELDTMRHAWTVESFKVNYGTPTTEQGWKEEAAKDFNRWGKETSYYQYCMKQAAKAHVEGK